MGKAQTMAGLIQGRGAKGHNLSIKINFSGLTVSHSKPCHSH